MKDCNLNIVDLLKVADDLLEVANKGDIDRNDDSCGVLYGLARDYANRLMREANREKDKHKSSNKWDS
jgi:hypothetical protein